MCSITNYFDTFLVIPREDADYLAGWMRLYHSWMAKTKIGTDESDAALALFSRLLARLQNDRYVGHEFDDFLASPFLNPIGRRSLLAARIFIQIGQRLPINTRAWLGVPKLTSTKAMGFIAKGLIRAGRGSDDEQLLPEAKRLLDWLLLNHSRGYSGLAWGNAFDFASRGGYYPKGAPTVVWTSHIGEAFLWAYEITQDERYRDAVVSSGRFVLDDLERHFDENGSCIAYSPGRLNLVHNSNLLGAVALLRAWKLTGDDEYFEVARSAFQWSLNYLRPDGSIAYGVGDQWDWIDNFHTAYVLDCLLEGRALGGDEIVSESALESSFDFWRSTFFLNDGTPKYYADKVYPSNIQCASQAIETFCRFSPERPELLEMANLVLNWTVDNMSRPDGYFIYSRGRVLKNRLPSLHWGQATMLDALGALLETSNRKST